MIFHNKCWVDLVKWCDMIQLIWNPDWETGVEKIDLRHHSLFEMTQDLLAAIYYREKANHILLIIYHLVEYADVHFAEEEAAMVTSGYPGLALHQLAHADFLTRARNLMSLYMETPEFIRENVINFLVDWQRAHVKVEDQAMAWYLVRWSKDYPEIFLPNVFLPRMD